MLLLNLSRSLTLASSIFQAPSSPYSPLPNFSHTFCLLYFFDFSAVLHLNLVYLSASIHLITAFYLCAVLPVSFDTLPLLMFQLVNHSLFIYHFMLPLRQPLPLNKPKRKLMLISQFCSQFSLCTHNMRLKEKLLCFRFCFISPCISVCTYKFVFTCCDNFKFSFFC